MVREATKAMEIYHDTPYLELLSELIASGKTKTDRTGTGTLMKVGHMMRFDLAEAFPLLTTKRVFWKAVVHELLWFIKGDTNLRYLAERGIGIWDDWPYKAYLMKAGLPVPDRDSVEWDEGSRAFAARIASDESFAKEHGELGPIYGYQWRNWPTPGGGHIDQLSQVIERIKRDPSSRRHIVSAWNVADIEEMAKAGLPPCHCLFQFFVVDGKLSCLLYQRSCDTFLGVPFNIASYALLTRMVAHVTGLPPGEFIWTGGDVHLYQNHIDQAKEQLARTPRPSPRLSFAREVPSIFDITYDDIILSGYDPHPAIKAPIAV